MLLANDCEHPDRMGDATARATGLPECRGFDATHDADGTLSRVDVRVVLPAEDRTHTDRYTVTYAVGDGTATPRKIERPRKREDQPVGVRTALTALLAAETAVGRFDGVEGVQTVGALTKEIWTREPEHGYEPVGASDAAVEQAVAEVSD